MRHLLRRLAYVLIVIGLLACGAATWIYSVFVQPGPRTTETTVIIPKGAGIGQITGLLAERGLGFKLAGVPRRCYGPRRR